MSDFEEITGFLDCLGDAIIIVNEISEIIFANSACADMFGYTNSEMRGMRIDQLMATSFEIDHGSMVKKFIQSHLPARGMMARGDILCIDAAKNILSTRISIASVSIDNQQYGAATIQDFTNLNNEINQLEVSSHQDNLTGLYNRRYLQKAIESPSRLVSGWKNIGVIFIDLNKFKQINDKYGHDVGDSVLVKVSQRIVSHLRFDDLVFRMGGDEFLVLLNLTSAPNKTSAIKGIANKIYHAVSSPIETERFCESVGLSMGCGIYPDQESNIESLIKLADQAMYSAKQSGKGVEYV